MTVYFSLYHDEELSLYNSSHAEVSRLNHTTVCKRKHPSVHEYYCPDTDDWVTAVCTGRRETIVTHCPQIERVTHCAMVDPYSRTVDASASASSSRPKRACRMAMSPCARARCPNLAEKALSWPAGCTISELVTLVSYSSTDMMIASSRWYELQHDIQWQGPPVLVAFLCVWLLLPLRCGCTAHECGRARALRGSKRTRWDPTQDT